MGLSKDLYEEPELKGTIKIRREMLSRATSKTGFEDIICNLNEIVFFFIYRREFLTSVRQLFPQGF